MSDANGVIEELITIIKQLIETKNPLSNVINNPKMLLEGLNDLKNMIEMNNIKIAIVEQIKLLITNKSRKENQDNHMLHTVITGDTGMGKTTVARILAKIWISLDMIKKPKKKIEKNYIEMLEKAIIEYEYKLDKLNTGLTSQAELMTKIRQQIISKKDSKLLTHVRNARFNLDKMIELSNTELEEEEEELKFTIASRDTLVASYVGQTAIKTKAVLEKAAGGVLFIDEAYSLYNSDRDSFGEECLTVINEFMSLRSDELIIIFAGYKDLLMHSIFKVQPGLNRRCMWFFEIQNYSQHALSLICKKQLENNGWLLSKEVDLHHILKKYKDIKNAGDIQKIVFFSKLSYSEHHFDNTLNKENFHDSIITHDMIIKAIEKFIRNKPTVKLDLPPSHMYL